MQILLLLMSTLITLLNCGRLKDWPDLHKVLPIPAHVVTKRLYDNNNSTLETLKTKTQCNQLQINHVYRRTILYTLVTKR